MICISINQESRRFALVDMLNAAPQCDLVEIRLDRFGQAPDLGDILTKKPRPVIMSCRRQADGGFWDGTEEERLALLRQCIISKADYVEIELDVADQIRPFPPAKRVISYYNFRETPADIADIHAAAQTKKPDVIKLTTLARTPEEAWPLVQILAKSDVPTVVVGLGKPGLMLTLLGKKIGAPWAYAALEKGMEAYPGQPTIRDLVQIYHFAAIEKGTRFIGVTGFDQRETATAAALNAVLAHCEMPARCLPLGVGSLRLFRKVIDAVKVAAVAVASEHQETLAGMADELHGAAKVTKTVDLLMHKSDAWHGFHAAPQAAASALAAALQAKFPVPNPIHNRMIAIVGLSGLARCLASDWIRKGASVILTSHQKKAGTEAAQALGCRFVQFEALYSTMHDVLVVCDEEKAETAARTPTHGIHASYLKAGMTVMDLSASFFDSELTQEAIGRGCQVVQARPLLVELLHVQCQKLTGKDVPREIIDKVIAGSYPERED
jgi:3-dehydroquinate dehydratase / shikimate dehydrogenase